MSLIDRSLDGMAFISGQLGAVLRRRLREVGGTALISLAMMAALALATWSVDDPSLSHATDAPVHNLLGHPGAIAADLMMQLLGLGSLALLLPIGVWGYRLLGHRPLGNERLRVLLWLLGAVLAAAFASCLPRGGHWPLPSGLGGVIGDAMLRLQAMVIGKPLAGTYRLVTAIVLGLTALAAFAGAAGIIWLGSADEEEDEERTRKVREEDESPDEESDEGDEGEEGEEGLISLGRFMHAALSLRSRLARGFRGRHLVSSRVSRVGRRPLPRTKTKTN
jgi:S-DNA-T family DNA segregation ATPase FtsK/SpoIIIE